MKKITSFLFVIIMLTTSICLSFVNASAMAMQILIKEGKKPPVRSAPSSSGEIVGYAQPDYVYEVMDTSGNWYKIVLEDGTEGWVGMGMVTVVDDSTIINPASNPTEEPSTSTSKEDNPVFNLDVFKASSLYKYDKFTKEWSIYGTYTKVYSDATIEISVLVFDTYVEKGWGPELRIAYFDKETRAYDKITEFRVLIGNTLYTFGVEPSENKSYAFGGSIMRDMLNSLRTGKDIAFQIVHTDQYGNSWRSTIDPVTKKELTDILTMAKLLESSNIWDTSSYYQKNDQTYNATKE